MNRGTDTRFAAIEDAANLLSMLPNAETIAWPTDAGDIDAIDEALRWMSAKLPVVRASLRAHKKAMREARQPARQT